MGCLDIWSNIILGISLGCFWMRLMFKLTDSKADCPPYGGGPHSISPKPEENKQHVTENSSFLAAFKRGHWFSCLHTQMETPWLCLGRVPAGLGMGTPPPALLDLQLASTPCRSWEVSLHNPMNQLLIITLSLYVCICMFMYVYIYTHTCSCIYVYMYVYRENICVCV